MKVSITTAATIILFCANTFCVNTYADPGDRVERLDNASDRAENARHDKLAGGLDNRAIGLNDA
ncbi:MAG: hypothetical protein ACI9ON_003977 [Limisphaerales bacterium]|jgi:hypothetical protein